MVFYELFISVKKSRKDHAGYCETSLLEDVIKKVIEKVEIPGIILNNRILEQNIKYGG